MLTPFGHRLRTDLENEFKRMDHEWFFRWHALSYGETVDVDNFDGQRIRYGGITFSGTAELVYWHAVSRYLQNQINNVFERAENEIRAVGHENAAAIANDAAGQLTSFCWRIFKHAETTDRALKGRGFPDPNYRSPHRGVVSFVQDIEQRKTALVAFYRPQPKPVDPPAREILTLKPTLWGIGVDLKEAWRQWWTRNRKRPPG